jgi:hypothetical protein
MMTPDQTLKEWKNACDSEMGTLERIKCWKVVDESTMPPDAELIDPKWVLKLKFVEFENGKYITHLKGRVVTKGYVKKRTSDFSSFSPPASQVTLKVILPLTVMVGFKSWDLDIACVFMSVPLPKGQNLYLKVIPGYPLPKGKVLKLLKTIYGLIQVPLDFYQL